RRPRARSRGGGVPRRESLGGTGDGRGSAHPATQRRGLPSAKRFRRSELFEAARRHALPEIPLSASPSRERPPRVLDGDGRVRQTRRTFLRREPFLKPPRGSLPDASADRHERIRRSPRPPPPLPPD